jgi:hypothetical protein
MGLHEDRMKATLSAPLLALHTGYTCSSLWQVLSRKLKPFFSKEQPYGTRNLVALGVGHCNLPVASYLAEEDIQWALSTEEASVWAAMGGALPSDKILGCPGTLPTHGATQVGCPRVKGCSHQPRHLLGRAQFYHPRRKGAEAASWVQLLCRKCDFRSHILGLRKLRKPPQYTWTRQKASGHPPASAL